MDRDLVIRNASERFANVLAATDPATPVPTCPGWTAVDLLTHLTGVHDFWATVIGRNLTASEVGEYEKSRAPLPSDRDALLPLRAQATDGLLAALHRRGPDDAAWSWFPPDQSVGFTWRMQTHEATLHLVDAELTAGSRLTPIADDVAAEGIDHVLDVMWAWAPAEVEKHDCGIVELVATNTGQRWLVRAFTWSGEAWGSSFTNQAACERALESDAEPSATVRGTVQDLDLLMWNRRDQGIERSGDKGVLAAFQKVVEEGIN